MRGHSFKGLAVVAAHYAECRTAHTHRLFQHRVEYRSGVARRLIDDLEQLGGGRLLFK
jgi:hypothetical protein